MSNPIEYTEEDAVALEQAKELLGQAAEIIEQVLRGKANARFWTTYLLNSIKGDIGGTGHGDPSRSLSKLIEEVEQEASYIENFKTGIDEAEAELSLLWDEMAGNSL